MNEELARIAERIVASAAPGEAVEAYVTTGQHTDIRVMDGALDSLTTATSSSVAVRIVSDHQQGISVAGTLDPDAVDEAISAARENLRYSAVDEHVRLATLADTGGESADSLDVWCDDVLGTATSSKVALAMELDAQTRSRDDRVDRVESSDYGDSAGETVILNSNGVQVYRRRTTAGISVVALADEGSTAYSGYGFSVGRAFSDLQLEEAVKRAVERAAGMLGARPIETARMPVVFDPLVSRSFIGLLASMLNGDALVRGRALFADRVGEPVASETVTLVEDPRDVNSFGAAATDAEGLATKPITLIDGGVLRAFLHNLYTGSRSGSGSTASATRSPSVPPGVGVRGLRLQPGNQDPQRLLAEIGHGIYVESLSGLHSGTNVVTGDFSVGAQGHVIRDGALAEPFREITIASTIPKMLLDLTGVANDTTWLSGSTAGNTIAFSEMSVSGS